MGRSFECNKVGHMYEYCLEKEPGKPQVQKNEQSKPHTANQNDRSKQKADIAHEHGNRKNEFAFYNEENELTKQFQNLKKEDWIVYSVASNHYTDEKDTIHKNEIIWNISVAMTGSQSLKITLKDENDKFGQV